MIETLSHLLGTLHPPLVHFAVACPVLAFLALASQFFWKKTWLPQAAASLWILGFFAGLAAWLTGHLFSIHLGMVSEWSPLPPETAMKGVLRDHAILGTLATLVSFIALWAARRTFKGKPLSPKLQLILGFLLAVLFVLTGHEGGEMVYESVEPASLASSAVTSDPIHLAEGYRQNLVKMNSKPWNSRTHGRRWVNTYVSKEAVEAYKNSNPLPEGSLVVKDSFEDDQGKVSTVPGPLYVMVKGKVADSPGTGGWRYALSWDKPVPGNPEKILESATWLPGDTHLNSCVKCHNRFKAIDYVGGIPEGYEK
jgi:uncharacterized membrane protein